MLSESLKEQIEELITLHPSKRAGLLMALHAMRNEIGYLTIEDLTELSSIIGESPAEIQSTANFYEMFHLQRPVKIRISACTSVSCMLRGCDEIVEYLKSRLGIGFGETTPDGLFHLEEAECLGACDTAPAIVINDKYFGNLTVNGLELLLNDLLAGKINIEDMR